MEAGLGIWKMFFRSLIMAAVIMEVEARRIAWRFFLLVQSAEEIRIAKIRTIRGSVMVAIISEAVVRAGFWICCARVRVAWFMLMLGCVLNR